MYKKEKLKFKKIFASLLLCTAISMNSIAFADSGTPDMKRADIHFSQMSTELYKANKLYSDLDEIEKLCTDEKNKEKVLALYKEIYDEMDKIYTASTINEIYYSKDVTNKKYAEQKNYYDRINLESTDKVYTVLNTVINSPCGPYLEEFVGADIAEMIKASEPMTEEASKLAIKESELVQKYDQLNAVKYKTPKEKNKALGGVFKELVIVRDQIAKESGYDNYLDYAYAYQYSRDYSPSDFAKVRKYVKNYIIPVYDQYASSITDEDDQIVQTIKGNSGEYVLNKIEPHINAFLPELKDSFAYMKKYGLYDIDADDKKMDGGYTCYLNSYKVPFIYNYPYNTYRDFKDMIHEFGHFNNAFYHEEHVITTDAYSLDIIEIQSQALELIFTEFADSIYGKDVAEPAKKIILSEMLATVMDGSVIDEFESAVYKNPEMSLEDMNRTYNDINSSYGLDYDDDDQDYLWTDIPHIFQSPGYYASYAISMLSAFDMWTQYLDNPEDAKEAYRKISLESYNMGYEAAIDQAGLLNIFDDSELFELSQNIAYSLDVQAPSKNYAKYLPAIILLVIAAGLIYRKRSSK
ncbi:MAG: hypothetical protein ACRC76_04455 [Proteocatella sp.]